MFAAFLTLAGIIIFVLLVVMISSLREASNSAKQVTLLVRFLVEINAIDKYAEWEASFAQKRSAADVKEKLLTRY